LYDRYGLLRVRRRLLFGVHDLHAPVFAGKGIGRVFELGLAVADGDERIPRQPELLDQNPLYRFGTALREVLVIICTALGVGVPVDEADGSLQLLVGQRSTERKERSEGLRADNVRVILKVNLDIDARLIPCELRNFPPFPRVRERAERLRGLSMKRRSSALRCCCSGEPEMARVLLDLNASRICASEGCARTDPGSANKNREPIRMAHAEPVLDSMTCLLAR
jgi:hypothetical protein